MNSFDRGLFLYRIFERPEPGMANFLLTGFVAGYEKKGIFTSVRLKGD